MKTKYVIGIIEDDDNKLASLKATLFEGFDDTTPSKQQKYADITFEPLNLDIKKHKDNILEVVKDLIAQKEIDAIFIDYKLSVYAVTSLTGVIISDYIKEYFESFPIFIMTAYEDDLYSKEVHSPDNVFDTERYLLDDKEKCEIHTKIVEKIKYHYNAIAQWEFELLSLTEKRDITEDERAKIIELDTKIESYLYTKNKLNKDQKTKLSVSKLDKLASEIEELIKGAIHE